MTPPPWPTPPPAPSSRRSTAVFAALAALLSVAALIVATVALTRTTSGPTHTTATQRAAAQATLCERYKLAAHAMHIETSDPSGEAALARVALTNGALMLDIASEDPALDAERRDAARALAGSYQTTAALGTTGMATRDQYLASVDDMNAKDRVMAELCGQ